MALTSRTHVSQATSARKTCVAVPVRPARRAVHVEANLKESGNYVGKAFMKIFSPPQSNVDSWKGTENNFTGKISHHESSKKPFSDGYVAKSGSASSKAAKVEEGSAPVDQGFMGYLAKAVERVLGNNFKGDQTEPDWKGAGSSGWKGKIHDRSRDGFHSKKL